MKKNLLRVFVISLALTILFSVIVLLRYDSPHFRNMYLQDETWIYLVLLLSTCCFFFTAAMMLLPLAPIVFVAIGILLVTFPFIFSVNDLRRTLRLDENSAWATTVFIFLTGLEILCFAGLSSIKKREKKEEEEYERTLRERYSPIYKKVFPDANCPEDGTLICKSLVDFITQKKNEAIEKYKKENHIQQEVDSCSNLGFCGISNTHFFYHIKAFSVNYSADDAYEVKLNGCRLKTAQIPLDSIKYYKIEGSIQYTSNVQGGGANMKGAALGALVGGDAGAIIGSRVGTETRTTVDSHDNRKITIFYEDGESIKTLDVISTNFNQTLTAFRKLIPQKEEAMVMLESKDTPVKTRRSSAAELIDLKNLLDCGIITQAEFDAKKKQLLGL